MSLKHSTSPSASSPVSKRVSPEELVESTHYYVLCQFPDPPQSKPRTKITRCYTTGGEALRFVRDLVHGWDPDIERQWEEFDDDNDDSALLLRVTARCSTPEVLGDLGLPREAIGDITVEVLREMVPIYKPLPLPPVLINLVYVVVQKDFGDVGVVSTLHNAYAERKAANCAARKVLRLVGGGLDAVGRIGCRHEESMDDEGLYAGCAYVQDAERERVEVVVERLDVK